MPGSTRNDQAKILLQHLGQSPLDASYLTSLRSSPAGCKKEPMYDAYRTVFDLLMDTRTKFENTLLILSFIPQEVLAHAGTQAKQAGRVVETAFNSPVSDRPAGQEATTEEVVTI